MRKLGNFLLLLTLIAVCLPGCLPTASMGTVPTAPLERLSLPLTKTSPDGDSQPLIGNESWPGRAGTPGSTQVRTVVSPENLPRPVSLIECLALALENGRTGELFDAAGSKRRSSVTGSGRVSSPSDASDSIRVFAYDPAMLATETEQSLSRFPQYCKNIAFAHVLAVLGKRLDQEPTGSGDQQELLMAGLYLNEPHAANVYGEGPQKEHGQDACNQG